MASQHTLRSLVRKSPLSLGELAKKSGIPEERVRGFVVDSRRLAPDEITLLARALGVRPDTSREPLWDAAIAANFSPESLVVRITSGHVEVVVVRHGREVRRLTGKTTAAVVAEMERTTEGRAA